METHSVIVFALSLITGFFLPWAIAFVARSEKRWLNLLIAYGSSVLVGAFNAFLAGNLSQDVFASLTASLAASQSAYTLYWKPQQKLFTEAE